MDAYWYEGIPGPYPGGVHQNKHLRLGRSDGLEHRVKRVERKLDELIRLMEENNRLLADVAKAGPNTVVPGGGGSTVVVRM